MHYIYQYSENACMEQGVGSLHCLGRLAHSSVAFFFLLTSKTINYSIRNCIIKCAFQRSFKSRPRSFDKMKN